MRQPGNAKRQVQFLEHRNMRAIQWNEQFAERTAQMKRTAVRELLKVAGRPEIVSFAGGLPDPELFPMAQVKAATQSLFDRTGGHCLQYAETEGLSGLRDWIAGQFSRDGLVVRRENVLITSGAQQGLDLIGRVLLDPGDRVMVENPTYLALLSAWRPFGVHFDAVPSDEQGMQVEQVFESLLERKPKLLYLVPNFQNPQGTTLTLPRRRKLMKLVQEHPVALIEDNPYGELRYDGHALPNLLQLDANDPKASRLETRVIYTGTFSKVLMPGLRVGWVIAAEPVIEKLVQAKQAADLHTSTLSQYLALELVRSGLLEEHVPRLRRCYAERRDLMLAALEKHFPPGVRWTRPEGGMFLLVTLPRPVNASTLLLQALEQRVAFVPGEEFHLDGEGVNTLRLNFSNARPSAIEAGIGRLAQVIRKAINQC